MVRIVKITAVVGLLALCSSALAVDSNGLVAHWKFDEGSGTTAVDSASSNDGTLVNGPTWTGGKIDGGLDFDGTNDYVTVADDSSLDISGAISVSAWIELNDNVNKQIIICKRGPGGWYPYGGYTFHFQDSDATGNVFRLMFTKTNGIAGSGGGNYGGNTNWDRIASNKDDWQTGAWYHVAATWDGTTDPDSMKMYIDGQLDSTHTAGQSFILTNSYVLTIGDILPQMTDPFDGVMDDVRIYDRALSAEEVEELYKEGFSAHELAVMKLEDASDKKQAALEIIEEALDAEWDAYGVLEEMLESKDYGDLNKRDIIKAKQGIHSTMQHQERAADTLDKSIDGLYDVLTSLGWEPEPNEPPEPNDPNLISHWKFDEGSGSTAYDSAGDNDGTITGASWTTGKINGALDFDGTNDRVEVADDDSLTPSSELTISAWIYINALSWIDRTAVVCKYAYWSPDRSYTLELGKGSNPDKSTACLVVSETTDPFNGKITCGTTQLQAGQWYHVVGTFEPDHQEIYINGTEETDDTDAKIADSIANNSEPLYIGYNKTEDTYFDGIIDDVRIYDKALTAAEVWQLYQNGL